MAREINNALRNWSKLSWSEDSTELLDLNELSDAGTLVLGFQAPVSHVRNFVAELTAYGVDAAVAPPESPVSFDVGNHEVVVIVDSNVAAPLSEAVTGYVSDLSHGAMQAKLKYSGRTFRFEIPERGSAEQVFELFHAVLEPPPGTGEPSNPGEPLPDSEDDG